MAIVQWYSTIQYFLIKEGNNSCRMNSKLFSTIEAVWWLPMCHHYMGLFPTL